MLENREIDNLVELCCELDIPPVNLSHYKIPLKVLDYISEDFARSREVIPLAKICSILTVAISTTANLISVLEDLKVTTGLEIQPVFSSPEKIKEAIEEYYGRKKMDGGFENTVKDLEEMREKVEFSYLQEEKFNIEELKRLAKDKQIVSIVNSIIVQALQMRASDIHIEPFEEEVRLRYRIDGVLQEINSWERKYERAIATRVKIMAKLDITVRHLPQDGRFTITFKGEDIDSRISVLPVEFGEKIVIRLLHRMGIELDIEKLGISPSVVKSLQKIINHPSGLFLITGPTGSGKTTTLYSILVHLNTPNRNILTIEDPVEYHLSGVTQINVKPEIGLTFASSLRAILRQAPDVIMVGEIRDLETAQIAMRAALTGSFILSTLHTNDALSTISRLKDIGVEKYLISSSLKATAAQRLCRKICPYCKKEVKVNTKEIAGLYPFKEKVATFWKGEGCVKCNHTGYLGRIPIMEMAVFDVTIKEMILKEASLDEITDYAEKELNFVNLRKDGVSKAIKGETSIEEVVKVTFA